MNPMRKPAQIHRAAPEDAANLTDIAFAAKRHWGYPERWIEKWRDVLTICPEFVARHELEIESDPNASGFYERMGARRVGATLTELDGQTRELPIFEYALFPKPAPGSL